jgi:hypothetical protein
VTTTFKVVNGDWVLNPASGRPVTVTGRTKLGQDLAEGLTIVIQSSGFGSSLGTNLGAVVDPFAFRLDATDRIRSFVRRLQGLQARFLTAERSGSERVASIASLTTNSITQGESAKVGYTFRLVVRPVSGDDLAVTRVVVV